MIYCFWMGPLRWAGYPSSYLSTTFGYPASTAGCSLVVFVDTFLQVGGLYLNTIVVGSIFYIVYFDRRTPKAKESRHYAILGYWICCIAIALPTVLSPVSSDYGW